MVSCLVSAWSRPSAGCPDTGGLPCADVVKVYAVVLCAGIIGLLVLVLGAVFAENLGRPERDPGARLGPAGKTAVGAALGFGMAGLSAEFSPLDLTWQVALVIAAAAAGLAALWVRYALARSEAG